MGNILEVMNYGNTIFESGLINFIISATILFIFSKLVNKYFINKIKNINVFYKNLLKTLLYGVCLFVILSEIIPLKRLGTAILGASSIIAVVVGIASQETLSNFVSGFIIAAYKPFDVGDVVSIVDKKINGVVKEIGFRHTTITTYDNTNIMVPNNIMNNSIIENKKSGVDLVRNKITLILDFNEDLDRVRSIIITLLDREPLLLNDKNKNASVNIFVSDILSYGKEITVYFYTKNSGDGFVLSNKLRENILIEFSKNGIRIPYPTNTILR